MKKNRKALNRAAIAALSASMAVSYTHLDVYKRQLFGNPAVFHTVL